MDTNRETLTPRIVAGTGRAYYRKRPRTLGGLLKRLFVWLLFRNWISLHIRQRALFASLHFAQWLTFTGIHLRIPIFSGGSMGDTFENDILKLIFNATAIANVADNAASSPLTNLYFGLHTSDPGESGSETTNEISYTGYARVAAARTSGGFTVSSNSVSPAAAVTFGAMTAGSGGTATHFHIGTAASGTGKILFSGTISPNIAVANGVTPQLTTATAITID